MEQLLAFIATVCLVASGFLVTWIGLDWIVAGKPPFELKPKKKKAVKVGTIVKHKPKGYPTGGFHLSETDKWQKIKSSAHNILCQSSCRTALLLYSNDAAGMKKYGYDYAYYVKTYSATINEATAEQTTLNMLDLFDKLEAKHVEAERKTKEAADKKAAKEAKISEIVERTVKATEEVGEAIS